MYQGEAGHKAYMEQFNHGIPGQLGSYGQGASVHLVNPSSVTVEKCENGFLVRIGYQKYIAVTATDVAELVAQKLQGAK